MHRAHKIRMYPTEAQKKLLWNTANCARAAYNWGLAKWKEMWKAVEDGTSTEKPSAFKLCKKWTVERPEWARDIAYCTQQASIHNVGVAYSRLFKGLADKPKFHKKSWGIGSFYVDNAKASIKNGKVRIPNVGWIKLSENLRFQGKINSYIVSTYAGKWYVSVSMEVPEEPKDIPDTIIGIDVGLDNPAWDSDNNHIVLPEKDLEKLERKLKRAQRALSRSQRNSHNYQKKLLKKQKVQDKINNIRQDVTHKYTTAITKSHGIVVIEDLDIEGMKEKAKKKGKAVRRSYNYSLMRAILFQLSYKANKLIKAPRFYPSSKTCSHCGALKSELPPKVRIYKCEHCGAVLDRDYNAALNLMKIGLVKPE